MATFSFAVPVLIARTLTQSWPLLPKRVTLRLALTFQMSASQLRQKPSVKERVEPWSWMTRNLREKFKSFQISVCPSLNQCQALLINYFQLVQLKRSSRSQVLGVLHPSDSSFPLLSSPLFPGASLFLVLSPSLVLLLPHILFL